MNSEYTDEKARPGKRDLLIFYSLELIVVGLILFTGPAFASNPFLIFVQIAGI